MHQPIIYKNLSLGGLNFALFLYLVFLIKSVCWGENTLISVKNAFHVKAGLSYYNGILHVPLRTSCGLCLLGGKT